MGKNGGLKHWKMDLQATQPTQHKTIYNEDWNDHNRDDMTNKTNVIKITGTTHAKPHKIERCGRNLQYHQNMLNCDLGHQSHPPNALENPRWNSGGPDHQGLNSLGNVLSSNLAASLFAEIVEHDFVIRCDKWVQHKWATCQTVNSNLVVLRPKQSWLKTITSIQYLDESENGDLPNGHSMRHAWFIKLTRDTLFSYKPTSSWWSFWVRHNSLWSNRVDNKHIKTDMFTHLGHDFPRRSTPSS